MSYILENIKESIEVHKKLADNTYIDILTKIAEAHVRTLRKGGKILIFGNGGSASDSLHIAAELVGRFVKERRGLPAISFASNISNLTAIGNDYGYENVFLRQIEALAVSGDIAFGLSTSGNSKNIIKAFEYAKNNKITTVAFVGEKKCALNDLADYIFHAPSKYTARIQECHILAAHIICGFIEKELFD